MLQAIPHGSLGQHGCDHMSALVKLPRHDAGGKAGDMLQRNWQLELHCGTAQLSMAAPQGR